MVKGAEPGEGPLGFVVTSLMTVRARGQKTDGTGARLQGLEEKAVLMKGRGRNREATGGGQSQEDLSFFSF